MNGFVIAVGTYVAPLLPKAKAAADMLVDYVRVYQPQAR